MRTTTREKYMSVLRYMHEQKKPFSMNDIKQNTKAHSTMLSSCVKIGLVERRNGKYIWVGSEPTKTTANRVHANLRKAYEKPVVKRVKRPKVRTFSMLWGLIKFNY